jgi:hypothetical protein
MARDMQALLCPNQRDAEGKQNARRDDGNGNCGRDWPDLVGRSDVQMGACAERGNEIGRASCRVTCLSGDEKARPQGDRER